MVVGCVGTISGEQVEAHQRKVEGPPATIPELVSSTLRCVCLGWLCGILQQVSFHFPQRIMKCYIGLK